MTIYSLDGLLSQFWTSPLFHVWFCFFLTGIQISQEAGKMVWYSHLFKNFPQLVMIHTVRESGVVNKVEEDIFLEFSCFFYDPWMLEIWSLVPLPFLNPACTSGCSQFTYYWNLSWRILILPCYHVKWAQLYGSLNIIYHCPCLGLEWKLTFSIAVTIAEFSKFADILNAAL